MSQGEVQEKCHSSQTSGALLLHKTQASTLTLHPSASHKLVSQAKGEMRD